MTEIPKSRSEGKSGGMNHTSSGRKTVKRGGDANKTGSPPNKSCALLLVITGASALLIGAGLSHVIRQLWE